MLRRPDFHHVLRRFRHQLENGAPGGAPIHTAVDGGRVSDRSLSRALPLPSASARTLALLSDRLNPRQHGRGLRLLGAPLPETGLKREYRLDSGTRERQ